MTAPLGRAPLLLALVWLAGVVVATSVGVLAVRLVAAQVGDPAVPALSAAAAASALPGAPGSSTGPPAPTPSTGAGLPTTAPPTTGPAATPSAPAPSPAGPPPVTRAFGSAGGELGVQCAGPAARLLYATPAAGYAVEERSSSGTEAEVRFEGGGTRVRLRVSCESGQPRLVEQRTDPAGGGEDGGGGGGEDGGGGGGEDSGGGGGEDSGGGGGGGGGDGGGGGGGGDD